MSQVTNMTQALERKQLEQRLDEIERLEREAGTAVIDFPYVEERANGSVRPLVRVANTKALLEHYRITVRYNEMTKDLEIEIPYKEFHSDTEGNVKVIEIVDRARHHGLQKTDIDQHLQHIAEAHHYHPVKDYIESTPWDGKSRLPELYDTVISGSPLKELLIRRWLTSAVAAVYEPNGIAAQGILVFVGEQGLGKTTWIKSLTPNPRWVKEGAMLNPSDKDSVLDVISHWLVELGELGSTFRKADLDALKAFITKDRDIVRPPYMAKPNKYARRSVLFGTVNDPRFLIDDENRRFWTIAVEAIEARHNIDIQQLWAEVRQLYLDNERWYLDRDEQRQLAGSNEEFEALDPIVELMDRYVLPPPLVRQADESLPEGSAAPLVEIAGGYLPSSEGVEVLNTTEILLRCGIKKPTKGELNTAAKRLRKIGCPFIKHGRRFQVRILPYLES